VDRIWLLTRYLRLVVDCPEGVALQSIGCVPCTVADKALAERALKVFLNTLSGRRQPPPTLLEARLEDQNHPSLDMVAG
jgi:hypothetical protein